MSDWKLGLRELIGRAGSGPRPTSEPSGEGPKPARIRAYLTEIVAPAFEEVATELQELGRHVEVDVDDRRASIAVWHEGFEEFFYEIRVRPYGAEQYSFPAVPLRDPQGKTYRAEAHIRERSLERDVTNASRDDLIQSFLDEYQRHLEWSR